MIRTQIQLSAEQAQRLRSFAKRHGTSLAQQVREAVARYLTELDRSHVPGLDTVAGKFVPLSTDDLKAHDRWFADAVRPTQKQPRS